MSRFLYPFLKLTINQKNLMPHVVHTLFALSQFRRAFSDKVTILTRLLKNPHVHVPGVHTCVVKRASGLGKGSDCVSHYSLMTAGSRASTVGMLSSACSLSLACTLPCVPLLLPCLAASHHALACSTEYKAGLSACVHTPCVSPWSELNQTGQRQGAVCLQHC